MNLCSDKLLTLEERKAARLQERRLLRRLKTGSAGKPVSESQPRRRALTYLAGLPTRQLLAIYKAAITHFPDNRELSQPEVE
jgi:hypothetical protein